MLNELLGYFDISKRSMGMEETTSVTIEDMAISVEPVQHATDELKVSISDASTGDVSSFIFSVDHLQSGYSSGLYAFSLRK